MSNLEILEMPTYWVRLSWVFKGRQIIGSWLKVQYDWDRQDIVKRAKEQNQKVEWKNRFREE